MQSMAFAFMPSGTGRNQFIGGRWERQKSSSSVEKLSLSLMQIYETGTCWTITYCKCYCANSIHIQRYNSTLSLHGSGWLICRLQADKQTNGLSRPQRISEWTKKKKTIAIGLPLAGCIYSMKDGCHRISIFFFSLLLFSVNLYFHLSHCSNVKVKLLQSKSNAFGWISMHTAQPILLLSVFRRASYTFVSKIDIFIFYSCCSSPLH